MKILIIDDHAIVRESLALLLARWTADAAILQAEAAVEALRLLEAQADIDLVILDFILPGANGPATIGALLKIRPDLPIVILSSSEDPVHVRAALGSGARGYVPKSASSSTLWPALQLALSGNVYVPPFMLAGLLPANAEDTSTAGARTRLASLTSRQRNVLRLLTTGLTNKEIGSELNMSEKTVKTHMTSIFRGLDVTNRADATQVFRGLNSEPTEEP